MDRSIGARLRQPRTQRAGDLALVAVLAGSSVIGVLSGDLSWGSPKSLALCLALASTVPVGWRSRYPLTAMAMVLVANGACVFAAVPHQAAFPPFVALTLTAYSTGSRAEGARAVWMPPVLAAAALPIFIASVAHGQEAGNAYPSYVWLVAAWGVGRTVRSWRHKSEELEQANRELAEQRERQEQAAIAVERGRIARELHDVVAHNVAMMVVQAGAAARVLEGDQPKVRDALDVIAETGRQTVDEMRTVLGIVRGDTQPAGLRPQPGLVHLDQLADTMREAGLPVTVQVAGEPHPLPQVVDLSAYRILQEALTNTLKHAGPASATVTITYNRSAVELEVHDSGVGNGHGNGTGNGLVGMRERAAMLGGELEADRTDSGFRVHARLPFAAPG